MSQMLAEISRIVNEDISTRVTQYDVLFEAITNSIHANATNISCYLKSNDNLLAEEGKPLGVIRVDEINIIDNGDGFNDLNYKSFCKYRTEYKKDLGCKGVGRFVFLKLYKSAEFVSKIKNLQEKRTLKFNVNFDTDDLQIEKADVKENNTSVKLSNITLQYYDIDRRIDRRIELDLYKIRQKVLMNLIPTLFFYKQKGQEIKIQFHNLNDNTSLIIGPSDIPNFARKEFPVFNGDGNPFIFYLNYKIEKKTGSLYAYYCANNRTVAEFEDKDLKISLPYGYSGFMLLESEYFNKQANHERNDFDIKPIRTDMFSTLSWEMINTELKRAINEIIKVGIPHTKKINKEKIQEIKDERPYLVEYLDSEDLDMAGILDKKTIIEKAKKQFDNAKEKILSNSGKDVYTDEELNDAIQLAQNELVSYINDRVHVIERLKKLVDDKERVEKIIHDLFMTKYTKEDYFTVGKNNLWLLDDRFTTFSYAASDRKIGKILGDLNESSEGIEILDDKPDLSLFFSHNPIYTKRLKSVVVEIKPFDYASKSDRKKYAGVTQLIDYLKAFKSRENIEEIYGYLVTEVDEKLADRLIGDNYIPLFSVDAPIYYRYYDKIGVSVFVVSAKTLICDAEARNKVFLDIIKKQAKINKLLGQEEIHATNSIIKSN
jgi:hypothetical protein